MQPIRIAIVVLAGLLAAASASSALAHPPRTRAHFGLYVGVPIVWPYWPYPYYYPPYRERVVVVPAEPTVYVEQPRPSAPETAYWYYCAGSGAYYPYVRECPGGWQRVPPRPPGE